MDKTKDIVADSDRLRRTFEVFHKANPEVYEKILGMCRRLRKTGWRKYSMRTIVSVLRFEQDLASTGEEVAVDAPERLRRVKLNNNHSPYYARLLVEEHPTEFAGFFEMRLAEGERKVGWDGPRAIPAEPRS